MLDALAEAVEQAERGFVPPARSSSRRIRLLAVVDGLTVPIGLEIDVPANASAAELRNEICCAVGDRIGWTWEPV